jgi:hypothetical protein
VSAAFDALPDKPAFDPLSGDDRSGFLGYAISTGTSLTHDPALG